MSRQTIDIGKKHPKNFMEQAIDRLLSYYVKAKEQLLKAH